MFLSRLRAYLLIDPLIVLATILFGSMSLVASAFDKTGRTQHALARVWARVLLRVSGVRVHVEGLEKLQPDASYVLVANHRSYMDTPVVLAHIPLQFRFFAKQGLFRIPLLGGHLRRAGHLPVVRGDPRASLKSVSAGARLIVQRGVSVLLFPEGGRSPAGMRDFKEGAAYLAIKAGVPAVPIGIGGTRQVLPMGSAVVQPRPVTLRIGDPIPTAGLKPTARGGLTETLQKRVAELMAG
ncbi:MAG TPA: lysophospholipid acyltransferase family protein [Bryobacteraceae bacterium]|nr:lysophospholipid acyltransferase family protein [Bryobacteraceae bacterium]